MGVGKKYLAYDGGTSDALCAVIWAYPAEAIRGLTSFSPVQISRLTFALWTHCKIEKRERERERERERDSERERERERERETERQRDRETERQRDRETERQRDRETERQRDRETERQRDRGGSGLRV